MGAFDIAPRTGHCVDGGTWASQQGRQAHIYVFAHHPVTGEAADHREPSQWDFYVVAAGVFKNSTQRTIGLKALRLIVPAAFKFDRLSEGVEEVRMRVRC